MVDLVRQTERGLDWPYIEAHLSELAAAKGDPALLPRLGNLRESARSR